MKKQIKFIIFISIFLLIFSCSVHEEITKKDLSIVSFGIETSYSERLKPGQIVKFFAKANKVKNVSYEWNFNGVVLDKQTDKVEYKIPEIAGTYTIIVTAKDIETQQKITHSEKLIVGNEFAELALENFKVKIKTKTKIVEKDFSNEQETEMQIESLDGNMNISVTNEEGTHNYVIEDGNMYEVEKTKSILGFNSQKNLLIKNIAFDISKSVNTTTESIFNTLCLNMGTPIKLNATTYSFTKDDSTSSSTIIYDSSINRITEIKVIDLKTKTISAIKYVYGNLAGHIYLKSMESAELSLDPKVSSATYSEMTFEWLIN